VTVPTYLKDFPNGKMPPEIMRCPDLDRSSTSQVWKMFAPVSWAMTAMQIAAKADGIRIPVGNPTALGNDNILDTTGRYRSYTQQENLFRSRYMPGAVNDKGCGSKLWNGERWYLQRSPGGGCYAMAATPGTSNHGLGLADDIAEDPDQFDGTAAVSIDDRTLAWLRDNAPSFGFGLETHKERWYWHWTGKDALSQRAADTLRDAGLTIPDLSEYGFTVPPPPQPPQEDEVTEQDITNIVNAITPVIEAKVAEGIAAATPAIVDAVYDELLTDPSVNKQVKARDLLKYTRGAAANADVATRSTTGWLWKDIQAIKAKTDSL
jgi:hypothetical protein